MEDKRDIILSEEFRQNLIVEDILENFEIRLEDGTILVSPTKDQLKVYKVSDEQVEEAKGQQRTLKFFNNEKDQLLIRQSAISALAIKADQANLGETYQKIVGTNAMQAIIADWKDTGNTKRAFESIDKIQGTVKTILDQEVGDKNRTIRNYLYHTMASATNSLHLLKISKD